MKFKYKGRPKSVNVIFSEGDIIEVNHDRSKRLMQGHPHFEEVKRGKPSGSNKSKHSNKGA